MKLAVYKFDDDDCYFAVFLGERLRYCYHNFAGCFREFRGCDAGDHILKNGVAACC